MENPVKLRLFDVCRHGSHVLGPGCRYVVWTQGCLRRCFGCLTPESQPLEGGVEVYVSDLAADILQQTFIDGITISGGEPLLQAKSLALMLHLVHEVRPELTIIVYTGFIYDNLKEDVSAKELLQHVDVLIDGEYVDSLNDGRGIRGSSNQRIIPITHRLDTFLKQMDTGMRHVERVSVDAEHYTSIGIPPKS